MRDQLLFSYGTLRQPEVQQALFGRPLEGAADAMTGWRTRMIEVTDPDVIAKSGTRFHPLVERSETPGDKVEGMAFEVTQAELLSADAYEVDYQRLEVDLLSGRKAWFYGAKS